MKMKTINNSIRDIKDNISFINFVKNYSDDYDNLPLSLRPKCIRKCIHVYGFDFVNNLKHPSFYSRVRHITCLSDYNDINFNKLSNYRNCEE